MIVVVTGMVGIDKKSYLQKVCQLAKEKGREVLLCNVGDQMYAEASEIPPGKILDIPMKKLQWLRRSVFKDIIAKAKKCENLIVNTHATFRWRHGLFPAVDFDQMREINADIYINLIDSITSVHKRLSAEHSIEHTLKDLIVWREEEIIGTEMLRNGINEKLPLYILGKGGEKETIETFYDLVFEEQKQKAYLSFPMTAVDKMKAVRRQIDDFRQLMKKYIICFDPADVEEAYLSQYAAHAVSEGKDYIELSILGENTRLQLNQVLQIQRDINSQTYARDFLLIDQSDMIISFIPATEDGRASISSGVERELQHAHETGKEVYVIWASKQTPSVFVTQTATKVFNSIEDLIKHFENKGYLKRNS